jgi:hypothetical protein
MRKIQYVLEKIKSVKGNVKAVISMRGIYGGTFSQTKEFKDDKHLDNWLAWMDKNQDRVKVIGTKII